MTTTVVPGSTLADATSLPTNFTFDGMRQFLPQADDISEMDHLYVYIGIVVLLVVMAQIRSLGFFRICMKASVELHGRMFQSVLRTPVKFFDDNPVGELTLEYLLCCPLVHTMDYRCEDTEKKLTNQEAINCYH
jgi:ABC-type multidrug transport system fused ATPase/permease subunit